MVNTTTLTFTFETTVDAQRFLERLASRGAHGLIASGCAGGGARATYIDSRGEVLYIDTMPTKHIVAALRRYPGMPNGLRDRLKAELRSRQDIWAKLGLEE